MKVIDLNSATALMSPNLVLMIFMTPSSMLWGD